ncbi:MAG: quinone-dependent dihydroorotate dehydrogenase [Bdellovibrionales bacterium]|nr:quinone-dependent dihydroorotate dehydrogenase [Bdellovibrionales bacterium]
MIKPWFLLPAKLAHDLAPIGLKLASAVCKSKQPSYAPFRWKGIQFQNPIGIAGGVDKNAEMIESFCKLGAGFIEIGTVTPKPQSPNPGVILKRDIPHRALWNKMGFPSKGVDFVKRQLQKQKKRDIPLFINIGKNRTTDNSKAHEDYIKCMQELSSWASAFVINISSPNTKGLRELLMPQNLEAFLQPIINENKNNPRPLLLKLSPDISNKELEQVLSISCKLGIEGFILTNTTQGERENLNFPEEGGVSGAPLAKKSLELLNYAHNYLKENQLSALLISTGGILSAADVKTRLNAGANLVQVYSALIFEGPLFFQKTLKTLNSDAVN